MTQGLYNGLMLLCGLVLIMLELIISTKNIDQKQSPWLDLCFIKQKYDIVIVSIRLGIISFKVKYVFELY